MIATVVWLAVLTAVQDQAPPANADPPAAIVAAKGNSNEREEQRKRKARIGAGRELFKDLLLLSILSILVMTLGALMLIHRMGRRLRNQKKAKPVKYFDLTVGDGPDPPPHEPSAEERLRGRE